MAPLKVLIVGGGVAGPSLAWWLARDGHHVTIVERFSALRANGAQIDLRAQGLDVVRKMGLMDAIRSKLVDEAGVAFVDSDNATKAIILANKSGKGRQGPTSEYEIMRGDLVRILYDATRDDVNYIFGKTVENFTQDQSSVTVTFSDGQKGTYDMLVGADGQGSRVRRDILPAGTSDPLNRLGLYLAYYFVPRTEADTNLRRMYQSAGGRLVMTRSHSKHEIQTYLGIRTDSEELRAVPKASVEKQKEFWTGLFKGNGWQTDRLLAGMQTTPDFYCQEVVQVKSPTWSKGRVVLLGDAAHCPSPISGMGTSGSFVGAYVLAGEISKNQDNLSKAFEEYDRVLRPFVDEIQRISPLVLKILYPHTRVGIMVLHFVLGLLTWLRIPQLLMSMMSDKRGGWELPEYSNAGKTR